MLPNEPAHLALSLAILGALVVASVLLSRLSRRTGLPLLLLFLGVGMLAGSEGLGRIAFEDYTLTFRIGTVALALILFDGGLSTPLSMLRRYWMPAAVLSTAGVVITALLVALGAWALGLPTQLALLLGAVVSSTDAAAIFATLRGSKLHLKTRPSAVLQLESGLNDPVAVILTVALTSEAINSSGLHAGLALEVAQQLVVGLIGGLAIGFAGRWVIRHARVAAVGLYPVLTLGVALLAFGAPTLLAGSGFLAVYLAGMVIGDGDLPQRGGLFRVHDAIAWFAQITMFLLLGLLSFPSHLIQVWPIGLAVAAVLALVARPVAVTLCLAAFRYPWREVVYLSWMGLRGAVPIILATYLVMAGAPGAEQVFNIVFFVVVANALIPGTTVAWATRRLGMQGKATPEPPAILEINTSRPLNGEIVSFYIEPASSVAGLAIKAVDFPPGSAVMLIVRGRELVAPKGGTVLTLGDHVYIFCHREDRPYFNLLFGRVEET